MGAQNDRFAKLKEFAPAVVRVGVALVFMWFGSSQLGDPGRWTALLPSWTTALPLSSNVFIELNGGFEVIFGLLLLFGFWVRPVALLLALHLFPIVMTVGYGPTGVRDFGLAMATVSVFLYGPDRFSFDVFLAGRGSRSKASAPR